MFNPQLTYFDVYLKAIVIRLLLKLNQFLALQSHIKKKEKTIFLRWRKLETRVKMHMQILP